MRRVTAPRFINRAWMEECLREINSKSIKKTVRGSREASWLIMRIAEADLPFKVINLGAGVKTITTEVDTCPKCHGTGKC